MRSASILCFVALASPLTAQKTQDEFFGLDRIWDIHIQLPRESWVAMYPSGRRSATRLFGKFPYRTADVTIGSHVLKDVAIRMKGNATFAANGGTLKKSLKLDFNRNQPKRRFLGMGKLNLQCNALDGTQIKEAVSYHVYRACGVPAGRTCFARVFLTMPGELDRAYVGLYTAVEQVDQRFARRTVGRGLILKPDGETLEWLGDSWNDDYERSYHPKSKPTRALTEPLIRTAALFDEPSDEVFAKGIGEVMDVEGFLKYVAATAILINTDSPLTVPDNYYLIVPKSTKKVTWVPWDMNWSMGAYGHITNTPTIDLSVFRPAHKEVFRRVLENAAFRDRYREILESFITGPCSADAMTAAVRSAHATVKDALAQEEKRHEKVTDAPRELGGRRTRHPMLQGRDGDDVQGLLEFAKKRERSVKAQLAGEESGRTARNLWGANARTVRGAHVRDLLAVSLGAAADFGKAEIGKAADASFARVDKDGTGTLRHGELEKAMRERWLATPRRRRQPDPSAVRARRSLQQLDGDGDGAVSAPEWKAGVQALSRFWDRDMDGRYSRRELGLQR